ncbi:MAG: HAD-IIB family hydrolase [Mycoplasma sp.]
MIKWIITDLDGTLLGADESNGVTIDNDTKQSWNKLAKSGKYKMTIATGRHFQNVLDIFKINDIHLPNDAYVIGMNGAQIYSVKKQCLIEDIVLDKNDISNFQKIINFHEEKYPNEYIFLGYKHGLDSIFFYDNKSPKFPFAMQKMIDEEDQSGIFEHTVINDFNEIESAYKGIIFHHTEWDYKKDKAELKLICPNQDFIMSHHSFLEIMPLGVNKLQALMKINKQWNFTKDEMIVFGDSFNDYEMLEYSSTSITRESSHPDIREICEHVIKGEISQFVGIGLRKVFRDEA